MLTSAACTGEMTLTGTPSADWRPADERAENFPGLGLCVTSVSHAVTLLGAAVRHLWSVHN